MGTGRAQDLIGPPRAQWQPTCKSQQPVFPPKLGKTCNNHLLEGGWWVWLQTSKVFVLSATILFPPQSDGPSMAMATLSAAPATALFLSPSPSHSLNCSWLVNRTCNRAQISDMYSGDCGGNRVCVCGVCVCVANIALYMAHGGHTCSFSHEQF